MLECTPTSTTIKKRKKAYGGLQKWDTASGVSISKNILQLLNSPWYPSMFLQVDDIIPYGG
jgi:hypothetical protein